MFQPMILDTDVVTSKSVETSYDSYYPDLPSKRGRGETLSNLPTHLVGNHILPEHILKRTGELAAAEDKNEVEAMFASTTTTVLPKIVSKSKFKRYHVPPEVRITHGLHASRTGKTV